MLIFEREINHNSLLNWTLIQKYQNVNKSSFIKDFKQLLRLKPKKLQQKKQAQTAIKDKLTKLMNPAEIDRYHLHQNKLLFSHRKTDNSKFFKSLLLKDQNCHSQIEKVRGKILISIRKNQQINQSQIAFIQPFLDYFGISNKRFELTNEQDRQKLKSCLTCLKKMMGDLQDKSTKQKLNERNKGYKLNLDLRYALSKAAQLIESQQIKIQLLNVLSISKNKKWLGVRFSRCLVSTIWTSQALRQLMRALTKTRIEQGDIQTNIDVFNSIYQKLRKNIKHFMLQIKRTERKRAKCYPQHKVQTQSFVIEEANKPLPQYDDKHTSNKEIQSVIKGISMINELYQLYSQQPQA